MNSAADLEALAHRPLPRVELSSEQLDEIASLARRLTQVYAQNAGLTQNEKLVRPYHACHEKEREGMRGGVLRVCQALVLLGYLDEQGAIVRP